MKLKFIHLLSILGFVLFIPIVSVAHPDFTVSEPENQNEDMVKLENPMTVQYLKKRLRKNSPRLILTPSIETNLRNKIIELGTCLIMPNSI